MVAFFCILMLIDIALKKIHKLYENNEEYPEQSSEDYIARLEKFNSAINLWEEQVLMGTLWRELFESAPVTANGTGIDSAPATFLWPAGSIWIGNIEYEFVRPEKARKLVKENTSKKIYWITGASGSYKINSYPAIGGGTVFDFDFYKKATQFDTGAEATEIEMRNPYYGINYVLSQLYLDDENSTQADFYLNLANESMEAMKISNEATPFYQDNQLDDIDDPGFGV